VGTEPLSGKGGAFWIPSAGSGLKSWRSVLSPSLPSFPFPEPLPQPTIPIIGLVTLLALLGVVVIAEVVTVVMMRRNNAGREGARPELSHGASSPR
jgi:hypothetical protein